ncbi:MAG: hypothetical protein QM764_11130 [Chitinophagaceae bacterium]
MFRANDITDWKSPILYQEVDIIYWLTMLLRIPDFITGYTAVVFDSLLFITAFLSSVFPRQNFTPILFYFTYFIYFILYNLTAGHHYINVGILFTSLPFIFKTTNLFSHFWNFVRFVFMFLMTSAGIWKIVRGNLSYPYQLTMIILPRKLNVLTSSTHSFYQKTIEWVVRNAAVSQIIWTLLILLELSFVIGYFTLKKDGILLIAYLLFFIGGIYLTGIYVIENLLFLITLVPIAKIIIRIAPIRQ